MPLPALHLLLVGLVAIALLVLLVTWRKWNPFIALLAMWIFGRACRFERSRILSFSEQSVASIGMVLLVVGGGGGFARVLRDTGIAGTLAELSSSMNLSPLLYAWLVAAFIRVATGSATVAITTAAGLMVPLTVADPGINRELLVLSMGFGSLFLSHLNDAGFWLVKEVLGLSVGETFRTWTALETIIGVVGLVFTLALGMAQG